MTTPDLDELERRAIGLGESPSVPISLSTTSLLWLIARAREAESQRHLFLADEERRKLTGDALQAEISLHNLEVTLTSLGLPTEKEGLRVEVERLRNDLYLSRLSGLNVARTFGADSGTIEAMERLAADAARKAGR